jgi:hypothetical protein
MMFFEPSSTFFKDKLSYVHCNSHETGFDVAIQRNKFQSAIWAKTRKRGEFAANFMEVFPPKSSLKDYQTQKLKALSEDLNLDVVEEKLHFFAVGSGKTSYFIPFLCYAFNMRFAENEKK